MIFRHEAVQFDIAQDGPFAPQRLRKQKPRRILHVQSRGMKLDKLHVADFRPGVISHSHAISSSVGRIGSVDIDLSRASGGQQD